MTYKEAYDVLKKEKEDAEETLCLRDMEMAIELEEAKSYISALGVAINLIEQKIKEENHDN